MRRLLAICLISAVYLPPASAADPQPLAGTELLTIEGDIAAQLVAGVDKFLLRKIDESTERRAQYWKRDFSSAEWQASVTDEHLEKVILDGGQSVGLSMLMVANPDLASKPDVIKALRAHVRGLAAK